MNHEFQQLDDIPFRINVTKWREHLASARILPDLDPEFSASSARSDLPAPLALVLIGGTKSPNRVTWQTSLDLCRLVRFTSSSREAWGEQI